MAGDMLVVDYTVLRVGDEVVARFDARVEVAV
jgi:hypothetical protein